ncbi:MAG: hypothetical protein LUE86_02470, partial [Clostridiales bacterium]|nr:hypothetical protein [Clostridiales bacterium]
SFPYIGSPAEPNGMIAPMALWFAPLVHFLHANGMILPQRGFCAAFIYDALRRIQSKQHSGHNHNIYKKFEKIGALH